MSWKDKHMRDWTADDVIAYTNSVAQDMDEEPVIPEAMFPQVEKCLEDFGPRGMRNGLHRLGLH